MGVPPVAIVVLVLIGFGAVGFQRGWLREITTLGVLLLGWLILAALGWDIVLATNKAYLALQFTLVGGFDAVDANALLRQLRAQPLINPRSPDLFLAFLYVLAAAGGYYAGQRLAPPRRTLSTQALGALGGAVNGYLITYVLVRYASPEARLSVSFNLTTGTIADTLGQYLSALLLAGIILAIALALLSAIRVRGASGRRGHEVGDRR
ncbi:MAG: hypothetical protein HYY04_10150 [Chloroflexi bacterium]|nr:hypothetical protein [Chloroflexota bacterium]